VSEPARHLHVVDPATGEVFDDCPSCAQKDDEIKGLERDVRAWAVRFAQLKREKDAEARQHKLWPKAVELFNLYRELTGRKGVKWSPDRFWLIEPFLGKDGPVMCELAIRGRVFEHFVTRRRNGTEKRHFDWEFIFRDRGTFEESANRAPADVRARLLGGSDAG
jgi:hypothetical protein